MKKWGLIALLPLSAMAGNCPDLAGVYTCGDDGRLEVVQSVNGNGITEYLLRFEEPTLASSFLSEDWNVIADNQTHAIPNKDVRNGTYVASCAGAYLHIEGQGIATDGGQDIGHFTFKTSAHRNGTDLIQTVEGTFQGQPIPKETKVCNLI